METNTNTSPQNAAAFGEQTLKVCPHTIIINTTMHAHPQCISPTAGLTTAAGFSIASASPKPVERLRLALVEAVNVDVCRCLSAVDL